MSVASHLLMNEVRLQRHSNSGDWRHLAPFMHWLTTDDRQTNRRTSDLLKLFSHFVETRLNKH